MTDEQARKKSGDELLGRIKKASDDDLRRYALTDDAAAIVEANIRLRKSSERLNRSSDRLERLTWVLVGFTVVLGLLTLPLTVEAGVHLYGLYRGSPESGARVSAAQPAEAPVVIDAFARLRATDAATSPGAPR
jgi:hypothetical protein